MARFKGLPARAKAAKPAMSEREFQDLVLAAAKVHGWLRVHMRPVRVQRKNGSCYYETPYDGDDGFLDTILVHPERGKLIIAELKVHPNKLTAAQTAWLDALRRSAGCLADVWYPEDWPKIEALLRGD